MKIVRDKAPGQQSVGVPLGDLPNGTPFRLLPPYGSGNQVYVKPRSSCNNSSCVNLDNGEFSTMSHDWLVQPLWKAVFYTGEEES